MKDIAEWLASIGLGEYAQRFAENRIDASVLRDLTDQDLEKTGIPLGHRKKMLRAIAELDCPIGPTRSRRHARRDRCLSRRLRPYHANL
jgi:SAM domain (Sterile alpha motif)